MALGTSEMWLILRARNEAANTLRGFRNDINGLDKDAMDMANAQMRKGQSMVALGAGIAAVGAAGVAALYGMTKDAIEFNRQAALTLTQTDGIGASLEDVKRQAKDVAAAIPAPFEEMQTALYDIYSSMDVTLGEGEMLLREFSRAAVAGQVDLQDAARGTIGILNAYNMKAEEVTRVNDVMFKLVQKGVGTYGEFSTTIGRAVPSAVRAGQSIEDLAGMLAFLTRNGLSTAMAASSAARALDAISNPKVVARLEQMGITVRNANGEFRPMSNLMEDLGKKMAGLTAPERAAAMKELFLGAGGTIQARRFFDVAVTGFTDLNRLTGHMVNSSGSLAGAYKIMFENPAAQVQLFKNNIAILRTELGEAFLPVLNLLLQPAIRLLQWFNDLDPATKRTIALVVGIVAALTTLIGIVTAFAGLWLMFSAAVTLAGAAMSTVLLTIGAVVLAVIALGVGLYLLVTRWDEIRAAVAGALESMGVDTEKLWARIKAAPGDVWEVLKSAASTTWEAIKTGISEFGEWAVGVITGTWDTVKNTVTDVWHAIAQAGRDFWDMLKGVFTGGMESIKREWAKWDSLWGPLKAAWDVIWGFLEDTWGFIKDLFEVALMLIIAAWKVAWPILLHVLKPILDLIMQLVRNVMQLVRGIIQTITGLITGDWKLFGEGLLTIIDAIWDAIYAVFKAAIGIVIGFFRGLVEGVISAARYLYDVIVGHSIIPDLIDAIIALFASLPGKILGPLKTFGANVIAAFAELYVGGKAKVVELITYLGTVPGKILNVFSNFGSLLYNAGSSLMSGLASGVRDAGQKVIDAAVAVVSKVKDLLPGSPIKSGPLVGWNRGGAGIRLMGMLADGIKAGGPQIESAMASALKGLDADAAFDPFAIGAGTGSNGRVDFASRGPESQGNVYTLHFGDIVLQSGGEAGAREFVSQLEAALGGMK